MQILDTCCDICNHNDNVHTAFPQRLVNANEHVQMQLPMNVRKTQRMNCCIAMCVFAIIDMHYFSL